MADEENGDKESTATPEPPELERARSRLQGEITPEPTTASSSRSHSKDLEVNHDGEGRSAEDIKEESEGPKIEAQEIVEQVQELGQVQSGEETAKEVATSKADSLMESKSFEPIPESGKEVPRGRIRRFCQRRFREMIGKHQLRNEELCKLEGDLRHRLDMLECSMPAVMVWNVWRMAQSGTPLASLHRTVEQQFPLCGKGSDGRPGRTASQHYDCRVRELEAERKLAEKRAEEARTILAEKQAALETRRQRLEEARRTQEEAKQRIDRLSQETSKLRSEASNQLEEARQCTAGECGDIKCRERWLRNISSDSSIGSTDLECLEKLQELAEAERTTKKQIAELERREESYMRALQQADELWAKQEDQTASVVGELQGQLGAKTSANHELAERVCQLEDQLENARSRLATCKTELAKYTDVESIERAIGRDDDYAKALDKGLTAKLRLSHARVGSDDAVATTLDEKVLAVVDTTDAGLDPRDEQVVDEAVSAGPDLTDAAVDRAFEEVITAEKQTDAPVEDVAEEETQTEMEEAQTEIAETQTEIEGTEFQRKDFVERYGEDGEDGKDGEDREESAGGEEGERGPSQVVGGQEGPTEGKESEEGVTKLKDKVEESTEIVEEDQVSPEIKERQAEPITEEKSEVGPTGNEEEQLPEVEEQQIEPTQRILVEFQEDQREPTGFQADLPTSTEPEERQRELRKYLSMLGSLSELDKDNDYGLCAPDFVCNDQVLTTTGLAQEDEEMVKEYLSLTGARSASPYVTTEVEIQTAPEMVNQLVGGPETDGVAEVDQPAALDHPADEERGKEVVRDVITPQAEHGDESAELAKSVRTTKSNQVQVAEEDAVVSLKQMRSWLDKIIAVQRTISKCSDCSVLKDTVDHLVEKIAEYGKIGKEKVPAADEQGITEGVESEVKEPTREEAEWIEPRIMNEEDSLQVGSTLEKEVVDAVEIPSKTMEEEPKEVEDVKQLLDPDGPIPVELEETFDAKSPMTKEDEKTSLSAEETPSETAGNGEPEEVIPPTEEDEVAGPAVTAVAAAMPAKVTEKAITSIDRWPLSRPYLAVADIEEREKEPSSWRSKKQTPLKQHVDRLDGMRAIISHGTQTTSIQVICRRREHGRSSQEVECTPREQITQRKTRWQRRGKDDSSVANAEIQTEKPTDAKGIRTEAEKQPIDLLTRLGPVDRFAVISDREIKSLAHGKKPEHVDRHKDKCTCCTCIENSSSTVNFLEKTTPRRNLPMPLLMLREMVEQTSLKVERLTSEDRKLAEAKRGRPASKLSSDEQVCPCEDGPVGKPMYRKRTVAEKRDMSCLAKVAKLKKNKDKNKERTSKTESFSEEKQGG